jgi:hypothetical protein
MLGDATASRRQRRNLRRWSSKWLITIAVMVGAMMEVLDTSIIDVG